MSIRPIRSACGDPIDLIVATCGADCGNGLRTIQCVFFAERCNCHVTICGSSSRLGETGAHPSILGQVDSTTGHPGQDICIGTLEPSKTAVRATHTAKGLVRAAIDDMLVGDLDSVHASSLCVQPNCTVVLGADACERWLISGFEGNSGVVAAAPGA